jgi:hypothetical protein
MHYVLLMFLVFHPSSGAPSFQLASAEFDTSDACDRAEADYHTMIELYIHRTTSAIEGPELTTLCVKKG